MSDNNDDSNISEDDAKIAINHLVDIFKAEGFEVSGCSFCANRRPKHEPRKCPFCKQLVYPVGMEPN